MQMLSSRDRRRNFRFGVLNGTVFRVTMVFIDSQIVLAWFLTQLGVSNFLIGLISPIRMGSSFLLQILVSGYLQQRPYKLPFYRAMALLRTLTLFGLALTMALIPLRSPWLVFAFFALLTLYSMGAGLTGIAFMDIVAKIVPPTRRGAFFGQRSFWGGILALGASALVGLILSEPGKLTFPLNVAILIVLAMVTLALSAGLWSMVKETPSEVTAASERLIAQVKRGGQFLRENVAYRTYILSRLAASLGEMAGPFYIVYAKTALGISAQMLGVYLTARTAALILSNLVWGRISDRTGNRRLLQIASALGLTMPLVALVLGLMTDSLPGEPYWLSWIYASVFVISGALMAAGNIARPGYLLDIAPPAQRPLYLGFTNTLFGVARFATLASGLIVDWAGFNVLLVISACFYGLAFLLSLMMVEPREGTSSLRPLTERLFQESSGVGKQVGFR